jgi:hypothetical protein
MRGVRLAFTGVAEETNTVVKVGDSRVRGCWVGGAVTVIFTVA